MADSTVGTGAIWPNYSKENVTAASSSRKSDALGKDDFLKILITQLGNQDPMQPLQDRDFIAQMAQFSSVEQLYNMTDEIKLLRQSVGFASSLIGKEVSWETIGDDGQPAISTGTVSSITVKQAQQYADVNGEQIPLEQLIKIANPAVPEPSNS